MSKHTFPNDATHKKVYKRLNKLTCDTVTTRSPWPEGLFWAFVYRVYDGDTVYVAYFLDGRQKKLTPPLTTKIRISGVDTPERRTKNKLEKKAANAIYKVIRDKLEGRVLPVRLHKHGKFGGRVIGDVYMGTSVQENLTLEDYLLEHHLARVYQGGKKQPWHDHELKAILKHCRKAKQSTL